MTETASSKTAGAPPRIAELLELRAAAGERFFTSQAPRLAQLCHRMAERFAAGGRLLALGQSPQARSDARHVAVEFVHPVIVGKRALPALALSGEGGPLAAQLRLAAEPGDIVVGLDATPLGPARQLGCLTAAFHAHSGAEWELVPAGADPFVAQEIVEVAYHILWELVHVFFEHRGLLEGRIARPVHDTGASSFLYPFLAERETGADEVLADVRRSVLTKARETAALRGQTLTDAAEELDDAAAALRQRLDAGGRLLALGNGGSATDAADAVADMRLPPGETWPPRPALDLTEDAGILTAIANDIGTDALFSRQIIAHGGELDILLAFSTSGTSANVVAALAEARRRGLLTIAMVGYDGGAIAAQRLADHVVVSRSEYIPRIQEAQASAWHVLRELVEQPSG